MYYVCVKSKSQKIEKPSPLPSLFAVLKHNDQREGTDKMHHISNVGTAVLGWSPALARILGFDLTQEYD